MVGSGSFGASGTIAAAFRSCTLNFDRGIFHSLSWLSGDAGCTLTSGSGAVSCSEVLDSIADVESGDSMLSEVRAVSTFSVVGADSSLSSAGMT